MALILDVLLIILLLATIVYAVVLHRRLAMLRSEKEGLETFLERMSQATAKADASLKGIRQAAEQTQTLLNEPIVKAQALRDELLFLIERADGTAERIADATSGKPQPAEAAPARRPARRAPPAQPQPAPPEAAAGNDGEARSQAERDLMNALRNVR
ncbi:MAG: DUF6468 domain-containing protein [Thalassobaculaceae bacterium]|nr:DUF6468 domain-containing protein [Thalassobaculaceae bacterium]